MKSLYNKVSIFSVLALVAFQNLQATSFSSEEIQDSQKIQKLIPLQPFDLLQDTLQKFKYDQYLPDSAFQHIEDISLEEIKQLQSTMTPDHEMFDALIKLILKTFPKHPDFEDILKVAQLKGESKAATPMAQYNLGIMYQSGEGVNINLHKAIEFYQKAADQGYAEAQYKLGLKYEYGRGVNRDLAQSLKWHLKSSEDKSTFHKSKHSLKSLLTFMPSMITPEDEESLIKNQKTLEDNIDYFLVLHDLEAGINQPDSSFKESDFAISSLIKTYQEIVNFKVVLLDAIKAFNQPGFMVTCLQPKNVEAFKSSHCPDIKYHEVQGKSFLTFGQNNIELADKLMTIFDQSQPVYGAISDILGVLTEIHKNHYKKIQMSDLAKNLKKQYISRLQLSPEDAISLAGRKKLIEKVEQEIEVLTQLQAIPQQLQDLLIEGAPVRNRIFLQKHDYIEPIFKD